MPLILEFLLNFVKPIAIAAIEREVLLASRTNIEGQSNCEATSNVLEKFDFPENPS